MNFLRCFLLSVSLCGLGVVWAKGAHPEWVVALDQWFCEKHVQDSQALWERVSSEGTDTQESELRDEVTQHLRDLGDVWSGERRFPLWKKLSLWLVGKQREAGDLEGAQYWVQRLLEASPNDVRQALVLAEVLIEKGQPRDLQQAEEVLHGLRLRMPGWEAVPEVEVRLALALRDWQGALQLLSEFREAGGASLAQGWQWFVSIEGQKRMERKDKPDVRVTDREYVVSCPLRAATHMVSLRVDPRPGAQGELRNVRYVGILEGGATVELQVRTARDCEWDGAEKNLKLTGATDPRVTLRIPRVALKEVQIHFQTRVPAPAWIWGMAGKHREFAELLAAKGLVPEPKGANL